MRLLLIFLFLAFPMLEIALLIKVGGAIGGWPLLAIVLISAAVGMLVLRSHGARLLQRLTEAMAEGRPPVAAALEGLLTGIAGLLLIFPGLITDVLGALLLLPPLRSAIAGWLSRQAHEIEDDGIVGEAYGPMPMEDREAQTQEWPFEEQPFGGGRQGKGRREPIVIEGEFERIEERTIDPKAESKTAKDKNGA